MILMYNVEGDRHLKNPYRKPPEKKAQNGKLSYNSKRKIKNALRWLSACATDKKCYSKKLKKWMPYKINLITLTFKNNMENDKLARNLLSKWLEMAKHRFKLTHYVWKAETQERGAIHFHIVTNIYIPFEEIRFTWNRLLLKNGFDQRRANSTDVEAITGVNNIASYLCEYFTNEKKQEGRRKIDGKIWGCSHGLSKAGKLSIEIGQHYAESCHVEWIKDSLEERMRRESKIPPSFLQHIGIWVPEKLTGLPKALFDTEIRLLKELEPKCPTELFPMGLLQSN